VREAATAGLSIARIRQITGLATTTIQRILNKPPGAAGIVIDVITAAQPFRINKTRRTRLTRR
jgi:hypothetical protein